MKAGTLFLLMLLVAIAAFAVLNWSIFIAPTTLSLGIADVQAPLGLIMLGLMTFLAGLFLVFVVYMQTSVLIDTRRHAKELHANRELADQAEASRFTELRTYLETELAKQASQNAESKEAIMVRLDRLEHDLRDTVEQSGNTLTAYIGELEDRLERGVRGVATLPPA